MALAHIRSIPSQELGNIGPGEKWTLFVFVLTAVGWVFRTEKDIGGLIIPGISTYFPYVHDSTIAIAGALLLFLLPVNRKEGIYTMNWEWAKKIPWGILILFGGGIALSKAFIASGLATYDSTARSSDTCDNAHCCNRRLPYDRSNIEYSNGLRYDANYGGDFSKHGNSPLHPDADSSIYLFHGIHASGGNTSKRSCLCFRLCHHAGHDAFGLGFEPDRDSLNYSAYVHSYHMGTGHNSGYAPMGSQPDNRPITFFFEVSRQTKHSIILLAVDDIQ